MPAGPYLFYADSRPVYVSDKDWAEFYVEEHLPELVASNAFTRAQFFEEIATPFNATPNGPRKFLAIYQTDHEEPMEIERQPPGSSTSKIFQTGKGDPEGILENGDFNVKQYHLIQEYDPMHVGEVPSPQSLMVEMYPQDEADFDKWYREEHLPMLAQMPGYRRTLRYRLGPRSPLCKEDDPCTYITIHEVDDLMKAFGSNESKVAGETPWTQKHIKDSKKVVIRGWKSLSSGGY